MYRLLGALIALSFLLSPNAYAAKCTGSATCRACTNCKYCAHCKAGGTCGVCARKPSTGPIRPTPQLPPAPRSAAAPPTRAPAVETPKGGVSGTAAKAAAKADGITLYFSPRGGCTDAIVEQIDKAKSSVKVQAYRLTSIPIVKSLAAAHERGLKVAVLLDKTQQSEKYSDATYFHNKGMKVLIDPKHAIAHNKVILIDERVIITGSFNFSAAAEDANAENLLIIEGKPELMAAYLKNYAEHESHAVPYRGVKAGADAGGGSHTDWIERVYRLACAPLFAVPASVSCCPLN